MSARARTIRPPSPVADGVVRRLLHSDPHGSSWRNRAGTIEASAPGRRQYAASASKRTFLISFIFGLPLLQTAIRLERRIREIPTKSTGR